uniref:Uncharacterized protein n=1 Tax=Bubo bubo TaxID=30461 RepID=A0A8C0E885_BUBBB
MDHTLDRTTASDFSRDVILSVAFTPIIICELCPTGWKLHCGRCYFYSETRDTWENSRRYCSGKKSELLVIEDETEMVSL